MHGERLQKKVALAMGFQPKLFGAPKVIGSIPGIVYEVTWEALFRMLYIVICFKSANKPRNPLLALLGSVVSERLNQ